MKTNKRVPVVGDAIIYIDSEVTFEGVVKSVRFDGALIVAIDLPYRKNKKLLESRVVYPFDLRYVEVIGNTLKRREPIIS